MSDEFDAALKKGHYSLLLDVAAREFLTAWQRAIGYPGVEESEALAAALRLLTDVVAPWTPHDWDPRPYIESQSWVFAKTMPQRPHEYVHLSKTTNWRGHMQMNRWLRSYGSLERYAGTKWPYKTVGGWRYWAGADPDWTIINRRKEP